MAVSSFVVCVMTAENTRGKFVIIDLDIYPYLYIVLIQPGFSHKEQACRYNLLMCFRNPSLRGKRA